MKIKVYDVCHSFDKTGEVDIRSRIKENRVIMAKFVKEKF